MANFTHALLSSSSYSPSPSLDSLARSNASFISGINATESWNEEEPIAHESMYTLIAYMMGVASTCLFGVQWIPQIMLNFNRKSVQGFSPSGAAMKWVGACFLLVNSYTASEPLPVVLYGVLNTVQVAVLISQFALWQDSKYFVWLAFPLLPYLMAQLFPLSVPYTSAIKPLLMFLSHFPQLYLCHQMRSTSGVSMTAMHINLVSGIAGAYMFAFVPPKNAAVWGVYLAAIFQAITIYIQHFLYTRVPRQSYQQILGSRWASWYQFIASKAESLSRLIYNPTFTEHKRKSSTQSFE
mmetsp:Transcript_16846/g.27865  ORF Transcript_16846/g.27865 Transcript_16846/m.27865 type:complete len:296 (+) Transcript_16846:136-1023(+)